MWADNFELVTSSSQIVDNGEYLIVSVEYNSKYYALGIVNGSFRDHVEVTVDEGVVSASVATTTSDTKPYIITLKKSGSNWNLYDAVNEKYLNAGYRASGKNKNNLSTDASVGTTTSGNNGVFSISVSAQGVATITNENSFQVQANPGSSRIASYRNGGQTDVCLYKKVVDENAVTTATTINADGITNTNKFFGTNAGTLTASVTYGSPATAVPGATVTWSSANTSVATVDASTGVVTLVGAGSTTITASYAGVANEYKSSSADYVLNVTDEDPNMVTLWSEDFSTSGYSDRSSAYGYTTTNSSGVQASDNYAGGDAPEMMVKTDGTFSATIPLENILGNLKLVFKTNAKGILTVSTTTDGVSISGTSEFSTKEEHTVTFTGITTSMTSIVIVFTAGSDNVRLDDIVLKGSKIVPATVSSAEYATFNSAYALDFSETGITAYTATDNGTSVALNEITTGKVPANTPVVLYKKNANGTAINVPVIASAPAIEGTNDLRVSTGTDVANMYVLANGTNGVGFYPWGGTNLSAGKVYLQGTSAAREFLGFENGTTAIETVKTQKVDGKYYNLAGQLVANPTKGLYIVNGKKVIIK